MSHPLDPVRPYEGAEGSSPWDGNQITDSEAFEAYLSDVVGPRVRDEEDGGLREVLVGLASTEMATEFVEDLLSEVPPLKSWEIGEALAECVLRDEAPGVVLWPWNQVRDRRTPRASLPGADLVGFFIADDGPSLLFGEVKTSSDGNSPPNVMYGGSGMTWQLEEEATRLDIQHALLVWLLRRTRGTPLETIFAEAVRRYVDTEGTHLLLMGVLVRDTSPAEADIASRARHLSTRCKGNMRVRVSAWYVPIPISDWTGALDQEAA